MPKFPRYESQRELTTQQPSFLAPESTEGKQLEALSKVGEVVQDTTSKLTQGLADSQRQVALRNYELEEAQVLERLQQDPNPDYEKYSSEIDKLVTKNTEGIKFGKNFLQGELSHKAAIAKIKTNNVVWKRAIDTGRAAVLDRLDGFSKSGDSSSIAALIEEQKGSNLFSQEDLVKLGSDYVKKAKRSMFSRDLNNDPALAEQNLTNNTYEFDIQELSLARDIYDKEIKKIQAVTENDLLTSYLQNKELSSDYVRVLLDQKKIDAKFAESLISKIENPNPDKVSQDKFYIEFQNRSAEILQNVDKVKPEELVKFMADSMDAHSKGLIDKSDFEKVFKGINEPIGKNLGAAAEQIMSKAKPKTLLERISFWSDEYADKKPEIKARMYRKLIDGISKGEDGGKLMKNIIDEEFSLILSEQLQKPNREYAVDPDTGERKAYSDDGGATWIDAKTGEVIK